MALGAFRRAISLMRTEWRYLMALRSVTSLLLGFSLAGAGPAAAQAPQDAASNPPQHRRHQNRLP